MRRLIPLVVLALTAAACTERLTTPGSCPALCPGGEVTVRDTFLTVLAGSDSSLGGFTGPTEVSSLLVSSGPGYGASRAVVRFIPRGDSLFVRDTSRTFTVDSVLIQVILQRRDTTVSGLLLDVYRLPRAIDTLVTLAELDAALTPDQLLRTVPIPDSAKAGPFGLTFTGADLAKLAFTPTDSSQLVIGLRLRNAAGGAVAARFGSARSGGQSPEFLSFVHVNIADTALQRQTIGRSPTRNFSVRPPTLAPSAQVLQVGGFPPTRAFLRFALPAYLRDSVTILRATLQLDGIAPLQGIPGDSIRFDVRGLLADFGAKSPIVGDRGAFLYLKPGSEDLEIDVTTLVTLWQGAAPLPAALRLGIQEEWSTFMVPQYRSSQAATGMPRLRVTYRPRFPFEGF